MSVAAPVAPGDHRAPVAAWPRRLPPVLAVAAGLIAAHLVLRGWVAASGFFYWDDFILVGEAARHPLWSPELLFSSHDGHVMPLAFATTGLLTAVAPLHWPAAVTVLLLGQLLAALAVLRLLVVLVGVRPRLLIPLLFYLCTPLSVPAFAWWAAALNALPLQIGLAWVSADALLAVRTGRRRYAVSAAVVFALALGFFEKSAVVLPVAFAVTALAAYVRGGAGSGGGVLAGTLRGAGALWTSCGAVLLAWAACYLLVVRKPRGLSGPARPGVLVRDGLSDGLIPALAGGPWRWERWQPATPWADPPAVTVVLSALVLLGVIAWSLRTRRRTGAVWLCAGAYVALGLIPVLVLRDGPGTAGLLLQSLRYFADLSVIGAVVLALVLLAPRRERSGLPPRWFGAPGTGPTAGVARPVPARIGRAGAERTAVLALTAVFCAGSVWSTVTFTRSWAPSPAREYVTGVRAVLPGLDAPLLPQEVPWEVLNPLAFPQNMTDRVFAPLAGQGSFATATPHLRMLTDDGRLVEASVWWNRSIVPGPAPGCGYRVGGAGATLPLDGPMQTRDWTAQINYLAARDGRIAVSFEGNAETVAEVRAGLNTVYVRLLGGGSALRIRTLPGDDAAAPPLCVGVGPVGVASFTR
ncbi:hypothetical protein ACWEVD_23730 [Nocardia thailandica]